MSELTCILWEYFLSFVLKLTYSTLKLLIPTSHFEKHTSHIIIYHYFEIPERGLYDGVYADTLDAVFGFRQFFFKHKVTEHSTCVIEEAK